MTEYLCALDAGTTGVRAVAVDAHGHILEHEYREFTQYFPQPGWVEHDATEIVNAIVDVTARLIANRGAAPIAIGITNQRETVVAWDRRTNEPLHRAIVWQDRRGARRCEELSATHLDRIRLLTGLVPDPYFSASKLEWLFQHGDIAKNHNLAVGTIDTWLTWRLTGGNVHATEVSNASRTMLFDINTLQWSAELCDLFGVPQSVLPEVRPSSGSFGVTHGIDGIPDGIPLSGIAGDQQASLFGHGCFTPGMAKNTYGTGSFVLVNAGSSRPDPGNGLLATLAWQIEGQPPTYALEGAIFSTGSAVQWLRDGLGIIQEAAEIETLAASCETTDGVILVPAFTGLGSPWWDSDARGMICGITRGTGRAEIARAVVDAMVFQTRDVVDAMNLVSSHPLHELRVDGGAAAMNLLCQMQANQLGIPVIRAANLETTALGAAFLAGLAQGMWANQNELADALDSGDRFEASSPPDDASFARWHQGIQRASREAAELVAERAV